MHWIAMPALKYLAAMALGLMLGATINGWRLNSQLSEQAATHAKELTSIAQLAATKAREIIEIQSRAQARVSELDRKYTDEIAIAQSETDRLRAAVDAGRSELRINARCPVPSDGLPSTTSTASVDDEPSARLDGPAERNYFLLRDRISLATSQITALQAYITTTCLK